MLSNTRHTHSGQSRDPGVSSHKRSSLRSRALLAISTAAVVAALSGSSLAAATSMPTQAAGAAQPTPTGSAPARTTQGIIMRDGGICDPIRHMGC